MTKNCLVDFVDDNLKLVKEGGDEKYVIKMLPNIDDGRSYEMCMICSN